MQGYPKKKEKKWKKRAKLVLLESDGKTLNLILFWSPFWKKFVDIGGRVDNNECFETTLIREVLEETSNLIDITNVVHSSKYIDVITNDEDIRVYFIIVDRFVFN